MGEFAQPACKRYNDENVTGQLYVHAQHNLAKHQKILHYPHCRRISALSVA